MIQMRNILKHNPIEIHLLYSAGITGRELAQRPTEGRMLAPPYIYAFWNWREIEAPPL